MFSYKGKMHYPLAALKLKWIKFERDLCFKFYKNLYRNLFICVFVGMYIIAPGIFLIILSLND